MPGAGPAFQVGHLVDRQRLLAAAVAVEDAADPGLGMPEVEQGDAVLAEQAGQVVAAVGRDQAVVGLPADVFVLGYLGLVRSGEVGDPDLAGVVEAEDESALARRVDQADDLGARALLAP